MRGLNQKALSKLSDQELSELSVEELCHCLTTAFYGENMEGTDSLLVSRVVAALVPAALLSSF